MGKLYRSKDKVIAGVCAGLAKEYNISVRNVRLLAVLLLILFNLLVLILYVVLAFVLPEE